MIDKVEVAITPEDTGATLHDKLAEAGAALILETLTKLEIIQQHGRNRMMHRVVMHQCFPKKWGGWILRSPQRNWNV